MCFRADSLPPIAAVRGGAVEHRHIELEAGDSNRFSAFEARGNGGTSVVVLPDVRGLYPFYEELALRFAERGHDAIALDYFGRTAETIGRDESFDFWPHVEQTTFEGIRLDVAAAIAHLRAGDAAGKIVSVGFCFGGSNSWHQAANGLGLAGAVGFYGHPGRAGFPVGAPAVIDRVDEIEAPILGLMGGADPGIPIEESDRFRAALDGAGISNEIVVYPGAPHSFFDRSYDEHAEASADAWARVLRFLERV